MCNDNDGDGDDDHDGHGGDDGKDDEDDDDDEDVLTLANSIKSSPVVITMYAAKSSNTGFVGGSALRCVTNQRCDPIRSDMTRPDPTGLAVASPPTFTQTKTGSGREMRWTEKTWSDRRSSRTWRPRSERTWSNSDPTISS